MSEPIREDAGDRVRIRRPCVRSDPVGTGRQAGFTLIEVVVAFALLAIGAIAVAGSITMAMATDTHAGEQTRATALAVDKLEYLKSLPAGDVDDVAVETINTRAVEDPDGRYRRWVEVVDDTEGARSNTKEVTVVVEFGAGARGTRRVEIFSILFVNS